MKKLNTGDALLRTAAAPAHLRWPRPGSSAEAGVEPALRGQPALNAMPARLRANRLTMLTMCLCPEWPSSYASGVHLTGAELGQRRVEEHHALGAEPV